MHPTCASCAAPVAGWNPAPHAGCHVQCQCNPQRKPWMEVMERGSFAKPANFAEVRSAVAQLLPMDALSLAVFPSLCNKLSVHDSA